MYKPFENLNLSYAQNVLNVAVVVAIAAEIAILPPNCPADAREEGAELTFCVGGTLGCYHRNDTNAADGSRNAAAVQFVHVAAEIAFIFGSH